MIQNDGGPFGRFWRRLSKNLTHEMERLKQRIRRLGVPRRLGKLVPLPDSDSPEPIVLFFAPEAGITPHFSQMCIMARSLQELGQRVLVTRCVRLFERCPVISGKRIPCDAPPKLFAKTCLDCGQNSIVALEKYGLDCIDLRHFMTAELQAIYSEAVNELETSQLIDFEFDGVQFGKLCTGDVSLVYKVHDFANPDDGIRQVWITFIRSAVLAYLLLDDFCRRFNVRSIVYSNDYSLMLTSRLAAQKHNIPVCGTMHACHRNVDYRRGITHHQLGGLRGEIVLEHWEKWRDLPLASARVQEIGDDLLMRLGGNGLMIYSPSKTFESSDLRETLGLAKDRKLLVAYTSSIDELVAIRAMCEALNVPRQPLNQPFPDQIAWLKALTEYVSSSQHLQLAVRIHPRESANEREAACSTHLPKLKQAFGQAIPNCHFFWPDDSVSSYDLAELADLALISWSSIGVELARAGIPVLASFNLPEISYPYGDFLHWESSSSVYFEKLEQLLTQPASLASITHACRWYNLYFLESALDFSDVVKDPAFGGLPKYEHVAAEAELLKEVVVAGKELLSLRSAQYLLGGAQYSEEAEEQALSRQLQRLIHFVVTGEDHANGVTCDVAFVDNLPFGSASDVDGHDPAARKNRLLVKGTHTVYETSNRRYERYSPMLTRLATILKAHSKSVTKAA